MLVLEQIYSREFREQGVGGIAHASSDAYYKLKGELTPDTSVELPPVFHDDTHKAQWFLRLMKALLLSRVIAKSPLENATDIYALKEPMIAFKDKGYRGKELIKLLIITHRLWTPKRMKQFVGSI